MLHVLMRIQIHGVPLRQFIAPIVSLVTVAKVKLEEIRIKVRVFSTTIL